MDMIWRRINDSGKNYRHVYKGLVLLEYCIAFGAEKVAEEARARIIQIKTLREFHHIDETGRDQGVKGEGVFSISLVLTSTQCARRPSGC